MAFNRAIETGEYPLGVFYMNPNKKTFEKNLNVYSKKKTPLFQRTIDINQIKALIDSKR